MTSAVPAADAAALLQAGVLGPRDTDIARQRLGLDPYERVHSRTEVAHHWGLTPERVRQIEQAVHGLLAGHGLTVTFPAGPRQPARAAVRRPTDPATPLMPPAAAPSATLAERQDDHARLTPRQRAHAALLALPARTGHRLDQLVASWLSTLDSPASRDRYARELREHLDYCTEHHLHPLTLGIPEFTLFVTWLRLRTGATGRPYAPATLNRKVDTVASFYAHLVDVDALDRSPVTRKARPRHHRRHPDKILPAADVEGLRADSATDHRTLGPRCAALITELLLALGLRAAEVCNLELDHLTWAEHDGQPVRGIRFTGKGGVEHVRGIPADLDQQFLTPYLAERPAPASLADAPALLLTRAGHRVNRFQVHRLWQRAHRRGQTSRRATPHFARHTWNHDADKAGISPTDRQHALGHRSLTTTMGYGYVPNTITGDPAHTLAAHRAARRHQHDQPNTAADSTTSAPAGPSDEPRSPA